MTLLGGDTGGRGELANPVGPFTKFPGASQPQSHPHSKRYLFRAREIKKKQNFLVASLASGQGRTKDILAQTLLASRWCVAITFLAFN